MTRYRLFAVALLLVASCLAYAQGDTADEEKHITAMEAHMTEALLSGDLAASESFLAPNYVRIYPDGSVTVTDDLRNSLQFTTLQISDQQVHVSGDTAVSVFKARVRATVSGHAIDGDFRGVRVWARRNGEWKVVAFSTTRIEAGP